MENRWYYDYEMYNEDIISIYKQIVKSKIKYDNIVGLVRGGLIPGVHLSHLLNIPFIAYDPKKTKYDNRFYSQNNLIVDDILDSGNTLNSLFGWKELKTAVLIWNVDQEYKPNYHGRKIHRDSDKTWVDFWWEMSPDTRYVIDKGPLGYYLVNEPDWNKDARKEN